MPAGDSHSTRIVADADVLAADLFVGGPARAALDLVRSHSWLTLVLTEPLIDDTSALITRFADETLASDWRSLITQSASIVDQPAGDHPALAAAYHGNAGHILSFDERLQSAEAGTAIRQQLETSIKSPAGFVRLFDPEPLYEAVIGESYSGPDRDPRG